MRKATPLKSIYLKDGKERSILRRHPWVFSGAVAKAAPEPENGEIVRVLDRKGAFLAYGAWTPGSFIALKLWSFDENQVPGEALIAQRIESAYQLRLRIFNGKLPDAYRLVYAESDGLPGLVADIYPGYAVCQITSSAMEGFRSAIGSILLKYVPLGVYERSDVDSRQKDGLPMRKGMICGQEIPDAIDFTENGLHFQCAPKTGHKTGFYLDQRMNRLAVMNAADERESVLNCFSYTGGFGLAALKGGAKHVLNIDTSEPALELAKQNAARNGFSPEAFETEAADVFLFLRKCRDSRKSFDMIILDPPKFADSAAQKEKAARGYKDLNLLALKLLRPGGALFTFSCSGAMDNDLFGKVIDSAAADTHIDLHIVQWLNQGPDHPVSAFFPEGHYLKGRYGIRPE